MTPPTGHPSFTEGSPFVRLLSHPSRVKIADVMLRRPQSEMSASEISGLAGITESAFSRNKEVFLEMGFMLVDDSGRESIYRLNTQKESVRQLGKAHTELLSDAEEIFEHLQEENLSFDEYLRKQAQKSPKTEEEQENNEKEATKKLATAMS